MPPEHLLERKKFDRRSKVVFFSHIHNENAKKRLEKRPPEYRAKVFYGLLILSSPLSSPLWGELERGFTFAII